MNLKSILTFFITFVLLFGCGKKKHSGNEHNQVWNDHYQNDPINPSKRKKFHNCGLLKDTKCTDEQIKLIGEYQNIVDEIISSSQRERDQLTKQFLKHSTKSKKTHPFTLSLFGESHINENVVTDNYSLIEKKYKIGDIILFEGNDSGQEVSYCHRNMVSDIFCIQKYNQKYNYYSPSLKDLFCANLLSDFFNIEAEVDFSQMKTKQAKCYYWDNLKAFDIKDNHKSLVERNKSMVNTVNNFKYQGNIFIVAGFLHSPIGEYYYNNFLGMKLEDINHKLYSMYPYIEDQGLQNTESFSYSTKEIANAFKNENMTYYSHKNLIERYSHENLDIDMTPNDL